MRYFFTAPALTQPTFETLQEYSIKKLKRLENLFKDVKDSELQIKISVTKEKDAFCITLEIYLSNVHKDIIIKERDWNLRRVIDKSVSQLKNEIVRTRNRKFNLSRRRKDKDRLEAEMFEDFE